MKVIYETAPDRYQVQCYDPDTGEWLEVASSSDREWCIAFASSRAHHTGWKWRFRVVDLR